LILKDILNFKKEKMNWQKKGLIYCPDGSETWARHSFMTPTPIVIDGVIRVYGCCRDDQGIARVRRVDLDINNPSKILDISTTPTLDVGIDGMFDDNGMTMGEVIKVGDEVWMYYLGFQKVSKVKFLAFSGLAISKDKGITFKRLKDTPVMDRNSDGIYVRTIHSVHKIGNIYRTYYSICNEWKIINGIPYGATKIMYLDSKDGIDFSSTGKICLDTDDHNYRLGRPRVSKIHDKYIMYCNADNKNKEYGAAKAESLDGISWKRVEMDIFTSESGWDSKMLTYPTILECGDKTYMFYNGNEMGKTGFGYAELISADD
jgi:hypothetical protein